MAQDGASHWLEGVQLLARYAGGVLFFASTVAVDSRAEVVYGQ
jgi:Ca2+/H+ antiporter